MFRLADMKKMTILATAGLTVLATIAWAQPPPGGGGRQGQGGGMRGGGMVSGTVAAVDVENGAIAITTQQGDQVSVTVGANVQISRRTAAALGDVQLGQVVSLTGVPTAMTVARLVIGDAPPRMGGPGGPGAPRAPAEGGGIGNIQPGAGGAAPGAPAGGAPVRPVAVQVYGKVTLLDPLTVTLDNGVAVLLTLPDDAQFAEITPVTLADIKEGELVYAQGQRNQDGSYNAFMVRLGEAAPRGGFGGFGGPGGPGGFGGPPPGGAPPGGGAPPPPPA